METLQYLVQVFFQVIQLSLPVVVVVVENVVDQKLMEIQESLYPVLD
jgi:hypothetical protein|tara:strand:+ start:390 stop:530 length:141 start_codon:yes stop_codon:yes gene_type:complete